MHLTETLWLEVKNHINMANHPVALTGAGISTASGIPLENAMMGKVEVRRLFDPDYLHHSPSEYYALYEIVQNEWRSALPNAAHVALARSTCRVITLNIDGLHRDAGSDELIEMHGNLRELRCEPCQTIFDSHSFLGRRPPRCPTCKTVLHPGICLLGDEVRHYSLAVEWVERCDVLLVIGTSLTDHPACELPQIAKKNGASIIRISSKAEHWVEKLLNQSQARMNEENWRNGTALESKS